MLCPRCGTESQPDNKFCKSCGAALGAAATAAPTAATAPQAGPPPPQAATAYGAPAPQPPMGGMPPQAPPGMVPMLYQAYPGGPQQVYYVPAAQGAHGQASAGVLEGLESKIRQLASTDKLEGFSLKDTFGQAFSKHTEDEMNDYLVTGSSRTTPPLELVETDWPKPWMFFRILALLAVAYAAFYGLFLYTNNGYDMPAVMVLGAFAVPLASLMLVWEMNTPRNISIVTLLKFIIIGGGCSIFIADLVYLLPLPQQGTSLFVVVPGGVEETAKILAVIIVTWGATSRRYSYQLNGILIGCSVGAGFACCETLGYGMNAFNQTLIQLVGQAQNGTPLAPIFAAATKAMVDNLTIRGVLAPFGHVVWCAISAGALWRVKGDKTVSFAMLLDGRFLKAFMIPMVMHDIWDISLSFPNNTFLNSTGGQACGWVVTGAISWYVLFTMIQQGLHQVRDMKKAQLEHTVQHVQATLGLGTMRPPMPPAPVPAPVR